jgi:hypothetical protein
MMQPLLMQSPPVPCYLVPLRTKHFPQHPILERPLPIFIPPLITTDQVSQLYETTQAMVFATKRWVI